MELNDVTKRSLSSRSEDAATILNVLNACLGLFEWDFGQNPCIFCRLEEDPISENIGIAWSDWTLRFSLVERVVRHDAEDGDLDITRHGLAEERCTEGLGFGCGLATPRSLSSSTRWTRCASSLHSQQSGPIRSWNLCQGNLGVGLGQDQEFHMLVPACTTLCTRLSRTTRCRRGASSTHHRLDLPKRFQLRFGCSRLLDPKSCGRFGHELSLHPVVRRFRLRPLVGDRLVYRVASQGSTHYGSCKGHGAPPRYPLVWTGTARG